MRHDPTAKQGLRELLPWLAPLALFLAFFVVLPVAGTITSSLFQETTFLERRFIFLGNFAQLRYDPGFLKSLKFTLLFVLASVPLETVLGLALALVINEPRRMKTVLRSAVLIPWAIPAAISGRVWELIYNYDFGLANRLVTGFGILPEPVNWLGTKAGAFTALVLADVWKTTPFAAIIFLAGLQMIPPELLQQARVDRAGPLRLLLRITLPLLRPVLIVVLVFRTIDAIRVFDIAYVITEGGPGGTTTPLSLYAYQHFLSGDFGYGSAISVALFGVALVLALIYVNLGTLRREIA